MGHRVCRWDGRPRGLRTRLQLFHVDNAATWTTADVCSDGSVVGRRWPCRHGRPSPAHPPRSPQIARQHATTAIPAAIVSKAAESRRRRSPPGRLGGRILNGVIALFCVISANSGSFRGALRKSSGSLSHLLMSSCLGQ